MPLYCQIWGIKIKTTHSYRQHYQLIPVIFCFKYLVLVFVESTDISNAKHFIFVSMEIKRLTCRWILKNLCANLIIFVWYIYDSLTIIRLTTIHKLIA